MISGAITVDRPAPAQFVWDDSMQLVLPAAQDHSASQRDSTATVPCHARLSPLEAFNMKIAN
ncbi:hypothetical protein PG996_015468 [Apiospora saccharicola]|uniref:Uncharacterized protein n=1 Tax=Apiospora saccharicola TaxID=335842 RepID=A0ABR1TNV4_9PEZI